MSTLNTVNKEKHIRFPTTIKEPVNLKRKVKKVKINATIKNGKSEESKCLNGIRKTQIITRAIIVRDMILAFVTSTSSFKTGKNQSKDILYNFLGYCF